MCKLAFVVFVLALDDFMHVLKTEGFGAFTYVTLKSTQRAINDSVLCFIILSGFWFLKLICSSNSVRNFVVSWPKLSKIVYLLCLQQYINAFCSNFQVRIYFR
jgi:hypothetical protein